MSETTHKPLDSDSRQIAETIIEQLGGRRFITMTGAKGFSYSGTALTFRLPIGKIGHCRIELTPMDVYTVTFYKREHLRTVAKNGAPTIASTHEGIYFDSLVELFERETGLATSLKVNFFR